MCSLEGHLDEVRSVAFSPDSKRVVSASGGNDGIVKIWNVPTGTEVGSFVGM